MTATPSPVDDTTTAADAYRLATGGTRMRYAGDYRNARQLLSAIARRIPDGTSSRRKSRRSGSAPAPTTAERFYAYRQARTHRARVLSMLLVPVVPGNAGHSGPRVDLRHSPDISDAWLHAFGPLEQPTLVSLQELLGAIGAEEWRRNGVFVDALDARIHPHYGTFAPVRGEYLDLVARADLPGHARAFDIGTGTGVLAAILARRGIREVIGTDTQQRAIACATENFAALGLAGRARAVPQDLFPEGRADVVVCNPPWLPGTPQTLLDHAIYDPRSAMLRAFLCELPAHLSPGGEGWLVLSDLAERLGLRSRQDLQQWIADAGLHVVGRDDTVPTHGRASDSDDPFHAERSAEVTTLWRLGARP
ncbi:class I SAM-dependent methyltransferase [Leucobacter rhizosphaerae]|uniref:Class I SAM-dependent methyltransferase n=1 Tax=Leucobacter rhizosphaerae TaxID=2932245 RepID=A0ABY4FYA1_9MICO|nr:class I SAM-dependent methyltransferase [Leucobacter rhizosphaerae]UOQ61278.1 class I SAM-dependent methyltransferase [Leucobacter rhizosphaerae]